jgi:putative flippase GtrA
VTPRAKRWLLFLIGGGLNTGLTYGVYLGLCPVLHYQQAYFFAYVLGIVFSYLFNARIVFGTPLSWRGLFAYPLVYLAQYLLSAAALGAVVELLHIPKLYAPLVVAAIMVPLTYAMSKVVLQFAGKTGTRPESKP